MGLKRVYRWESAKIQEGTTILPEELGFEAFKSELYQLLNTRGATRHLSHDAI